MLFRSTTTEYLYESSRLPVYTVELHPRYYGYVKARFFMHKNIVVYQGDSRAFLRCLVKDPTLIQKQIFFYLDAHWGEDLPLKEEIQFIFETFPKAVIMVDDFRVPGDEEYGYDDYGEGKVLSLEYLNPLNKKLKLAVFFPSKRAELETGAKRGCVVLAKAPDLIEILGGVTTLVAHSKCHLPDSPIHERTNDNQ